MAQHETAWVLILGCAQGRRVVFKVEHYGEFPLERREFGSIHLIDNGIAQSIPQEVRDRWSRGRRWLDEATRRFNRVLAMSKAPALHDKCQIVADEILGILARYDRAADDSPEQDTAVQELERLAGSPWLDMREAA